MAARYISGGDKLQKRLDEIAAKLKKGGRVKVGFLEGATYPDGTSVAMVAAIQEFGAPAAGIPPRPFFRNMITAKSPEWPNAVENLVKVNDYDTDKVLGQMGAGIAGQLRQSVVDTNDPPNAPSTIKSKGATKPLVDTGHMLNSIDFEVESE